MDNKDIVKVILGHLYWPTWPKYAQINKLWSNVVAKMPSLEPPVPSNRLDADMVYELSKIIAHILSTIKENWTYTIDDRVIYVSEVMEVEYIDYTIYITFPNGMTSMQYAISATSFRDNYTYSNGCIQYRMTINKCGNYRSCIAINSPIHCWEYLKYKLATMLVKR
jgi:hypothetical protein